jgi:hypothetical protein
MAPAKTARAIGISVAAFGTQTASLCAAGIGTSCAAFSAGPAGMPAASLASTHAATRCAALVSDAPDCAALDPHSAAV